MTHQPEDTAIAAVMETLIMNGFEGMADAFGILFNEAMRIERSGFLRADHYERNGDRVGYANGFKDKSIKARVGNVFLKVPQVRNLPEGMEGFYPRSLEKGLRSERALKLAIAEMYVQGVSTRKVAKITEELCGLDVSSTEVSRAAKLLDEELLTWRTRPLGAIPYLVLDARYEKVRHGGSVIDCALLIAVGVREDGKRSVLGVSVSLSEAEVHWRQFLTSLTERGMHGLKYVVSDDHQGLKKALTVLSPCTLRQRCQFHLQRNAQAYVPKVAMRAGVAEAIRNVFNAPDLEEAERQLGLLIKKYESSAPELAKWAAKNIPEGLTVFELPASHRKRLRTTNGLERVNKEVKRRTRVATLFPNEASLLRLASAVLAEISEEWETGKVYISI